jgi:hypothetical protein
LHEQVSFMNRISVRFSSERRVYLPFQILRRCKSLRLLIACLPNDCLSKAGVLSVAPGQPRVTSTVPVVSIRFIGRHSFSVSKRQTGGVFQAMALGTAAARRRCVYPELQGRVRQTDDELVGEFRP